MHIQWTQGRWIRYFQGSKEVKKWWHLSPLIGWRMPVTWHWWCNVSEINKRRLRCVVQNNGLANWNSPIEGLRCEGWLMVMWGTKGLGTALKRWSVFGNRWRRIIYHIENYRLKNSRRAAPIRGLNACTWRVTEPRAKYKRWSPIAIGKM